MIRRVRELMAVPFARPPQACRPVWRFLPEIAAGGVYAVLALAAAIGALGGASTPVSGAVRWAYLAAALAAVGLPAAMAAVTISAERDRGTLETLKLLPVKGEALLWGRFWHLVMPWLRFFVWLLPVYALCGAYASAPIAGLDRESARLAFWALSPGQVLAGFLVLGGGGTGGAVPGGIVYAVALRLGTDALGVVLSAAAGLFASARVRSSAAALGVGPAAALAATLGLAGAPTWAVLAVNRMTGGGGADDRLAVLYVIWTVLAVMLQAALVRRLVTSTARDLELATGTEPERGPERSPD